MTFHLVLFTTLLALLCLTAESYTRWYDLEAKSYNHNQYIVEYQKRYASESEHRFRKSIFERNLASVIAHNKKNLSWKEGVNQFTDRTPEELRAMNGYKSKKLPRRDPRHAHVRTGKALPSQVDYRKKAGVLSSVKDQGHCGSCWAVSSASTIESQMYMANGSSASLSIQQIASCTNNPNHEGGDGGCEGGLPEVAFQSLVKSGGLTSEWTYPYRSYFGSDYPCLNMTERKPVVKLTSFKDTTPNDYHNFMDALAHVGPFSILVDASQGWSKYESGIFAGCTQAIRLDHAVQVVGYGSEFGQDFWIVRNSWGVVWGEHGFIRLLREFPNKCDQSMTEPICGECGILFYGSYPIIDKNSINL